MAQLTSSLVIILLVTNTSLFYEAYRAGQHPGYVDTAWAGLQESIDVIADRGIKVVINGGSINPSGLAQKVAALVCVPTKFAR
jgi:hypothetical protein